MTRPRPVGETRQDRRRQWIVGLGVVLIFILITSNLLAGVINYRSQTQHHTMTVKQDAEIIALIKTVHDAQITNKGTLTSVQTLETEVASVIRGLPAADAELAQFAQWLEVCIGSDHEINCPAPPIAASS